MRTAYLGLAVLLSIPVAGASAQDIQFPERRAGQWEIVMETDTGPATTATFCLDAETDRQMMAAGMSMSQGMCETTNTNNSGGTITIDATCTMGAMKTISHTVMTGDFQSAYESTTTSTIEGGPPGMPANSTIVQRATWTGDCQNGLAPGDMVMPGGMKMNVRDLMGMMGGG